MEEMDKDPKNWKLGIFYFNPEDKRLWVPKRIPLLGITINFANPNSIFVLVLIVLGIVLATKLS